MDGKFYKKHKVYSMIWGSMDLSRYHCAASPNGGPIAMILNEKRIVSFQGQSNRPVLHIYTSAGKLLNQIQWDKGVIVGMGWVSEERLVCVMEQGFIILLNLDGSSTQISLGEDAKEFGIMDAVIRANEVVILTNHYQFLSISNLNEPRPKEMPDLGLTEPPGCWGFLSSDITSSGHLEIFCATKGTVFIIDHANCQDQVILHHFSPAQSNYS